MGMRRNRVLVGVSVCLGLWVLRSNSARAQAVTCDALANPLYVTATSLVKPYFARTASKLASDAAAPVNIVYQSKSTCVAYGQIEPGSPMTGTAVYWDTTGEKSCELPAAGVTPDLAMGDLSWHTCFNAEQPADVSAVQTFVQAVGFVVPLSSSQTAITAEECNVLLKYGAAAGNQVKPWTDPQFVVVRNPNSSTQWLNGLACGVPGNAYSSNLVNTNAVSADVLAKVSAQSTTANAEKTIGILATDYYDNVRDKVKMLAFQSYKQCSGAYLPDSSATAFDKKNVRDGHYGTFGYTLGMTKLGADKQPTSVRAKRLLDFMSGTEAVNGADPIADAARVGLVPTCAMSVRRTTDGGDLERFAPDQPCGCAFEAAAGKTSCEACPAGMCTGGKVCRFGYCEGK
jgi:hypothetical protein